MDIYGTSFSIESMKVIAESIGIPNLPDDAAKELSDNITYCCKVIIQDSFKCMSHSKRVKLLPVDIDDALNMKNIEPIYGLTVSQFLPFKHASGGGRELHFTDEKEVDFEDLLTNLNPKSALETHLRTHWLAIEGVQPTVPENPPPVDKSAQKLESISFKCMSHSKRVKLLPVDIDDALNMKNIEPIYGLTVSQFLPFKHASGGGRELHFTDEKEVDFEDLLTNLNPKSALETHLRTHWLAIEGVQPTVPENPPPVDKSAQKLESIDPISKLGKKDKDTSGKPTSAKLEKLRNVETVHVKQLATHELSVEQQLYYKEITEACVGKYSQFYMGLSKDFCFNTKSWLGSRNSPLFCCS
ncbi:transcription initiation factor TFIID subunit 6 [Diaphorina citri]|uniref:Transcription initiation factor TFIID subunit 6 n=1 Tax=Diaphorina citri TaxID=121845 RepID=A0A3Q0ITS9_DIACI|nr:transcription initiation factor TFIID subunit 6 [Diaphorina citri]